MRVTNFWQLTEGCLFCGWSQLAHTYWKGKSGNWNWTCS